MEKITVATNTLMYRALEKDLVVSCLHDKVEISRLSRGQRAGEPDVLAHVDIVRRTSRLEPVSLAGKLFVSLLASGG